MSTTSDHHRPPAGNLFKLILAWSIVGLPLALGVFETIRNATDLFR